MPTCDYCGTRFEKGPSCPSCGLRVDSSSKDYIARPFPRPPFPSGHPPPPSEPRVYEPSLPQPSSAPPEKNSTGLVLGILSIVLCWIPFFVGGILGIIGLIFSVPKKRANAQFGIAGFSLSISGIILTTAILIGSSMSVWFIGNSGPLYGPEALNPLPPEEEPHPEIKGTFSIAMWGTDKNWTIFLYSPSGGDIDIWDIIIVLEHNDVQMVRADYSCVPSITIHECNILRYEAEGQGNITIYDNNGNWILDSGDKINIDPLVGADWTSGWSIVILCNGKTALDKRLPGP